MQSFYRSHLPSLALLVLLAAGCGGVPIPNLDSPGSTIVAFGDSITYGVGAGNEPTYPELLAAALNTEVINAGVPGDTTADGRARLDEVLGDDPWLVILELGGNDLLGQRPLEATEADLRAILEGLLAARVAVLMVEIHGPFGSKYQDLFDRLEEDYRVPVLRDVLPSILLDPKLKADPIHPNAAGYRRLAAAVAKAVEPAVKKRQEIL